MLSAVEFLAITLVVICLALAFIPMRRHLIRRGGGAFDCAVRFAPIPTLGDASGWSFAVGRYRELTVELYRVFSYSPRPRTSLARRGFDVVGRREAVGEETRTLLPGWSVLECSAAGEAVELAMSPESMMAFLTWVEAAPPGWNISRVS
ncbi:DUF2550 domain-containing protein [Catenulispora subtropica]|uniref:DUF2550 domain-containing protein n=1 Tax=Catenulispora subtropica TaxID=450798 RepID=A0ABN2TE49_9ACTN